ncbi:hypothetical protein BU15DRAFT_69096 [Melanogaster broomeanus]|nr:hypothetical protein BU15DRAFT_69096 [Melanogaster broomeanus]
MPTLLGTSPIADTLTHILASPGLRSNAALPLFWSPTLLPQASLSSNPLDPGILLSTDPMVGNITSVAFGSLSDIGSPMQSVRSTLSTESKSTGVQPISVAPRRVMRRDPQFASDVANGDSMDLLTAAHICQLKSDIRKAIKRTMHFKRCLACQSVQADFALCNEIEYKVDRALGSALQDIGGHLGAIANSNETKLDPGQGGSHKASCVCPHIVSLSHIARVLRSGGRHISAAFCPREPITVTGGPKYSMPGGWNNSDLSL